MPFHRVLRALVEPALVLVDALLQGRVNGLEVAERARQAGIDLPIIAMTAHDSIQKARAMALKA